MCLFSSKFSNFSSSELSLFFFVFFPEIYSFFSIHIDGKMLSYVPDQK